MSGRGGDAREARLRVLIVDDEPLARASIRGCLRHDPGVEIVGECSTASEAAASIRAVHPDLVFLDVQMPEGTGFDVVRAVGPDRMPLTVFVTAYDRYAIHAFRVEAIDYVLKPVDADRVEEAVRRARRRLRRERGGRLVARLESVVRRLEATEEQEEEGVSAEGAAEGVEGYVRRLTVRSRDRVLLVPVDEVRWIEAADDYVYVHVGDRRYLIRQRIGDLEARLDPAFFIRIHRSTLVNLEAVRCFEKEFHGSYAAVLSDGTRLRVSRTRKQHVESVLGQPL